jgi:Tfp pilus assembly protein PilF
MNSRKQNDSNDNVIHVAFGRGGGRIEPLELPEVELNLGLDDEDEETDAVAHVFSPSEVAKLFNISVQRVTALSRSKVVEPTGELNGKRAYSFQDLVVIRTVLSLLEKKVKLRDVGKAVSKLRDLLPEDGQPLTKMRIVSDGKRVVVRDQEHAYEPLTGQLMLEFEVRQVERDVVRLLQPRGRRDRQREAFDCYLKAIELDENQKTMAEAELLYRKAIDLDPWLAIAYTNLGNIKFRQGSEEEAISLYKKALSIDPEQPEAQYNMGYVCLDKGELDQAVRFFEGAVLGDSQFADAHFYLALSYETLGSKEKARPAWERYLELEPTGTWADIAREHILPTNRNCSHAGSCYRRRCCRHGMLVRTRSIVARSMSTTTIPTPSEHCATTSPHGSATKLLP